jgi:hypothetical protein
VLSDMPVPTLPADEPERSPREEQRAGSEKTLVLLMIAVSAVNYFDRTILSVAAPTLIRESDTPREAGGLMSWAASKAVEIRV